MEYEPTPPQAWVSQIRKFAAENKPAGWHVQLHFKELQDPVPSGLGRKRLRSRGDPKYTYQYNGTHTRIIKSKS